MTVANLQFQQKTERLTDAFRIFNELSENLAYSYQGLQQQVANLTQELAAVRSERISTWIEKERLANRLQQILGALPAAVIVINRQGQIIDCNTHAIAMLGEPLLGVLWSQAMARSMTFEADSPHECQLQDGRKINMTISPLTNDGEHLILLSDVSELRHLQDAMARQKHLTAMGEMVAGLAHQVRTPLATAILYASHTVKPELDEFKRRQFSAKILERLHHLERQVNDMLIFAKQGRMSMQQFSLLALLERLAEAMEPYMVEFITDGPDHDTVLLGNEDALRGALLNLLNNACEAGARQIVLKIEQTAAQLIMTISDDGPGIDAPQLAQIFEPFYTTKSNGTGLGLAVVQSVIDAHHGAIQCQSNVGSGSCFTVTLPITDVDQLGLSDPTNPVSGACHHESI